jgi:hypothetical protein
MSEITQLLLSKQTGKVRKGAILLQKNVIPEMENYVLEALQNEIITNKSWETQSELFKCIGINNYRKASSILESIAEKNEEYDMVTISVGTALIRVKRLEKNDVSELLKRLKTMKYSLGYGMLDALGYDKMLPNNEDIKTIIKSTWDFGISREKGFVDPRYGLAAACAGWDKEIVRDFLNHCIATGDVPLKYVSENSLKGKYVKLR